MEERIVAVLHTRAHVRPAALGPRASQDRHDSSRGISPPEHGPFVASGRRRRPVQTGVFFRLSDMASEEPRPGQSEPAGRTAPRFAARVQSISRKRLSPTTADTPRRLTYVGADERSVGLWRLASLAHFGRIRSQLNCWRYTATHSLSILPDYLAQNLDLIVCGSGAGARSAEVGQYYAGPGNRFWHTLFDVGLTPTELAPDQAAHLLTFGIGLTDVVKDHAGSDRDLSFTIADTLILRMKITFNQPWYLCFNGKRAARAFLRSTALQYGVHGRIGRTTLFVAPSTSGAANGSWDLAPWQDLARRVCRPRSTNRGRFRSP